jgi:hypothetical protein
VELVDKLTWGVASIALTAIKNADCVGFEKHNRPIGDPHLQDENRMNRVSFRCKCQWRLPMDGAVQQLPVAIRRAICHSCSGIVSAGNDGF